ncbi:MAG TPA: MMPL family transporter [Nocardioidaceae bacterium]
MLHTLATFSVRHRWFVVLTWVALVAGATVAGQAAGGSFSNDLSVEGTDSQAAYDTLSAEFPEMSGDGMQVVVHAEDGVDKPSVKREVEAALDTVRDQEGVAAAESPYAAAQPMVSADGTTAMATIRFDDRAKDIEEAQITDAQTAFDTLEEQGVQVEFGGPALDGESGPSGSEAIGLAAAVVVLLLAFGSVFAMIVPLVTAVMALGLGMGLIHLLAGQVSIGTAGPVVAAMIGLGVGIDYALLVVTRHREGLAEGRPAAESIPVALSTAGRSVLVAGTTVIVAILSLYLIGIPFVETLGLASAITVATTLLAAVTLLPALLGIFGERLDRFRVRRTRLDHGEGRVSRWHRWTRHVQRRPWPYLLASVALLVAMAAPLLDLQLGTADDGSAPEGSTERAAYELIEDSFGAGWTGPLLVTAEYDGRDATQAGATTLRKDLAATEGVAQVGPPRFNEAGDVALLTVVPETSPDEPETEALVEEIRDSVASSTDEGQVHVGGATATSIDLADKLEERMAWFMGFVVALSFLLLMVEFRSIFVPVKAAIMNLLSVGAAYGAVVAVFQWGWLADLVGAQPGPIESFAPMMLFAVLFGLSMDYEVFLLSRVREEYVRTGRPGPAVADGIAATARVITAAAAVMVVVFSSFLLNDERVVNLFGFGLAVAIAIDATVVRLVLVPATMAVAGRAAWYMPRWLDRLLPRISHAPEPPDPIESELEEIVAAEESGSGRPLDPVALPGPAGPLLEPTDALHALERALAESRVLEERHVQLQREHAALQERYDALVGALRTLQDVSATDRRSSPD